MALTPEELAAATAAGIDPSKAEAFIANTKQATVATEDFQEQIDGTSGALEKLNNGLGHVGVSLTSIGALADDQRVKFGLLAAGVLGAKERFKELAGMDTTRLGSIGKPIQSLIDTIGHLSPGSKLANEALDKLGTSLAGMGATGPAFREALAIGGDSLVKFAKGFITGADNSLRFQSALLQSIASGGNFNKMLQTGIGSFDAMQNNLEGLNKTTEQFTTTMIRAGRAVGLNADDIAPFAIALVQTRAGLEAMANGMDIAGMHTDALTAIIRLADGAMIDRKQLIQDINKVSNDYGMTTVHATELMVRQREIADSLGATMGDVHEAMTKTLSAYSMFTRNGVDSAKVTQGVTDSVLSWSQALEKAGVSAHNATLLAAKYTEQVKDMDEAQESFVNQQTGGSGGLLGTLEYELLREKDPQAAARKAMEAMKIEMKKQGFGGELITKQQAVQMGEAGARQYVAQRQVAQSGIFGMKPGSNAEADIMVETAISGGDIGKSISDEQKRQMLAQTVGTGRAAENLGRTGLKEAEITADEANITAGIINLGTTQNAIAAGSGGIQANGQGINTRGQDILRERQRAAEQYAPVKEGTRQILSDVGNTTQDMVAYGVSAFDSLKRQMTSPEAMNKVLQQAGFGSMITKEQAKEKGEAGARQYEFERQIMSPVKGGAASKEDTDAMITAMAAAGGASGGGPVPTALPGLQGTPGAPPKTTGTGTVLPGLQGLGPRAGGAAATSTIRGIGATTAAGQVGRVIPGIGRGGETTAAGTTPGGARTIGGLGAAGNTGPVPVSLANGTSITVNLTGACPHCGRGIQQSQHTTMQNSASSVPPQTGPGY